jgi:hypothetical protein
MRRWRARTSIACFVTYALLALTFWGAGALAYWRAGGGAERLLGLLYLPSLALPVVGRGELVGVPVDSAVWWWWFAAQAAVAATGMWLYPYDRAPRAPLFSPLGTARSPVSVG